MKKIILAYLIPLFFSAQAVAQSGSIKGRVITSDRLPAAYVNIILENTNKGTSTDVEGKFELQNVEPGAYTLTASFVGLKKEQQNITVSAGKTTEVREIILEADQEALQEIVVQGYRQESYVAEIPSKSLRLQGPLVEAPQNIQVITKQLLTDQQAFDMLETVSRNVSGAQMIEHWGTFARLNMRGFKIPAFRNGMNVDVPWGPLTEDMSMVERIEFVKGPAGFMLSSGEPGGLYNVVTKAPRLHQQNEVSMTVGSFNTLRSTLDFGGQLGANNKLLYRMNLMGSTKGSHRDYEFNNRFTVAPSVKYQFNDRTSVTGKYIYQQSNMSLIGAAYVFSANEMGELPRDFTFAEPNIEPSVIREHNIFVDFNHKLNDQWEVTAKIGYLNYKQIGTSLWVNSVEENGDAERTLSSFDAFNESKLGQLYLTGNFATATVDHAVLAGVDLGHKDYFADWWQGGVLGRGQTFNIYNPQYGVPMDSLPAFERQRSIRQRATMGSYPAIQGQRYSSLYVQDKLSFFNNKARLTLGGRYTAFNGWSYGASTDDQVFTPRVGLNITVLKNTSLYGMFDQSFLPQSGTTTEGDPFVPVRAENLEAGLKREWAEGKWSSTLAAYRIRKSNLVVGHPDEEVLAENPFAQIQLGEVESKGLEMDIQGELAKGLQLILNYALTDVRITEDTQENNIGNRIAGHARHMANSWLHYQFTTQSLKGLGLSLGTQYQADRSSWNWSADNESVLPNYFRMDGAVSYHRNKFNIKLNVNNLLNDYLYSGSAYATYYYWQTEAGINYRLNVNYKF